MKNLLEISVLAAILICRFGFKIGQSFCPVERNPLKEFVQKRGEYLQCLEKKFQENVQELANKISEIQYIAENL